MSEQDQKNALPNDPWTQENLATEASDESCTTMDDCSRPFASDAPSLNMAAGPDNSPSLQCDQYPICKIKIGERHRRDLGDIDELAASIANVGLLHPVVITPDGTLIAGQRRLAACKKLGWLTVPVHIVDIGEIARGEFAENAYRKRFLPTEVHAIWRALEPIERAAAQERQRVTRFGNGGGKLPPPIKGKTRDKVAKLAGVSGRTMDKIAEVMEAANANARYEPLVRMMDQTKSVHGAYNELKAMRAAEAEAAANDGVRRPKAPIQLSAAAYNAAFPQYPPLSEYNGVVYGVWLCGSSWHGGRLHGQYPSNFLPRALALFPGVKDIFHCPSGTLVGPGLTIDRISDEVRCPQLIADAAELPLPTASMDVGMSDPPYTRRDSKHMDVPHFR